MKWCEARGDRRLFEGGHSGEPKAFRRSVALDLKTSVSKENSPGKPAGRDQTP